ECLYPSRSRRTRLRGAHRARARRDNGRHGCRVVEGTRLSRRAGDASVNAYPLPYSWARAQRAVLLLRPGASKLTISARTPAWAIREILRCHGEVPLTTVSDDVLETLLNAAYSDTADAASVMGVAENEIDLDRLMQDIPEVADLLETQDDAPVIRMINALFAQAARDGASDMHIEPYETHSV